MLTVHVRAKAKLRRCAARADGSLDVWTTAAPQDGKANKDVIAQVAEHLGIPPSRIEIVRGASAKTKTLRVS